MFMGTVKCPVYKLYLFYLMIQEKLQLILHQIKIAEPNPLVNR